MSEKNTFLMYGEEDSIDNCPSGSLCSEVNLLSVKGGEKK